MGLINRLLGISEIAREVRGTAEVFHANRTALAEQEHVENVEALRQLAAEFGGTGQGWFGRLVDGLNRLPRPAMALGTLGLFGFAMAAPEAFAQRMQGLALVPDPLWWLLGAVVSFYFGARELHYFRRQRIEVPPPPRTQTHEDAHGTAQTANDNAALADWRAAA